MRPSSILPSVLLCGSLASAWSGIDNAVEVDDYDLGMLYERDPQAITLGDTNAATPNPSATITTSPSTQTSSASQSSSDQSGTQSSGSGSNSASGGDSQTASGTQSGTSSGSESSSSTAPTSFSANLPPGGISMMNPNTASSTVYYKIGDYVTFAWNYTSLSVTPTAVDILATCTANQHTYTLALNQSVPANGTQAVTWDTQATGTAVPLLTETYTLIVYDAAKSVSASPSPGYLDTFDTFQFAMYTPQPYQNMSEWTCVTCSGAGALERQGVAFVGLMAAFAVLGATFFSHGFL